MIGIVIVSHSAKLAEGVHELVAQMVQGKVKIAVAGGIDDPDNPIGTDALKVQKAIEAVYSEEGVLVLMDLGSALLSAEMALEFLPPEKQANVQLCAAPLVEGAIAAGVQASVGGTIQQVAKEAREALAAKKNQLHPAAAQEEKEETPPAATAAETQEICLTVRNRQGLHARPAAQFVATANRFTAGIEVGKAGQFVNAKSINQVATLGVRKGDKIVIRATGSDAGAALVAIQALAGDNFGESEEEASVLPLPSETAKRAKEGQLTGIAASPGIAVGPVAHYRPTLPKVVEQKVENVEQEWQRLQTAVAAAGEEIKTLHEQALQQVGPSEAAIFEAHQMFLQDPTLLDDAKNRLFEQQINAEAAWEAAIEAAAETFRAMDNEYFRARAADVLDVGRRVLRRLMGIGLPSLDFAQPSILVAADLTPSDTAQLKPDRVLGICTETGGATSHSAILSRALGIPAIVGMGEALGELDEGQMIAIDGTEGRLWRQPDEAQLQALRRQRDEWLAQQQEAKKRSQQPAITRDGRRIEVAANIGGPHDTAVALEYGAEGVGLFRTEFLFMERESAPTEEEQVAAYRQAAKEMRKRPLIVRTLDVGGDKPIPYLEQDQEDNPFLGWRGIRFCLDQPHFFKTQLRAILRAGAGYNLKVMFPMIGALSEVHAARQLLAEARQELRQDGNPFDEEMEVGIMIEVPSAVAIADQLAAEVDFFSIGTNDLTQYVMAADRGNAKVADLAQALQPAVLRLVQQTAKAAHAAGIWVGMCGELAGNALATPVLVGLGLDELSMSAPAIPAVKEAVRRLTVAEAQQIAEKVLEMDSAAAVKAFLAPEKEK